MTFDEKRKVLLERFDREVAELRRIAADPQWTNQDYPPFKKVASEFDWSLRHLRLLNEAENL